MLIIVFPLEPMLLDLSSQPPLRLRRVLSLLVLGFLMRVFVDRFLLSSVLIQADILYERTTQFSFFRSRPGFPLFLLDVFVGSAFHFEGMDPLSFPYMYVHPRATSSTFSLFDNVPLFPSFPSIFVCDQRNKDPHNVNNQ